MSLIDRIRRKVRGPTDEEISEMSQALGGPAYPIPPLSTTLPTLPSTDEWMPETQTDLPAVREEAMTTEPHTDNEVLPERVTGPRSDERLPDVDPRAYPGDSTPLDDPPPVRDVRPTCPHCRGTGHVLTVNDLLRESIGLLGNDGDAVIRTFYAALLKHAPELDYLFPRDLLAEIPYGAESAGSGPQQRDRLLVALVAVAKNYDPEYPERMAALDSTLERYGRSHAAFQRQDGSVRGATLDEYHVVKVMLFNTLHDVAGAAWRPEFDDAWSEAYDYAAAGMLFHGQRSGFRYGRTARR